jgi:hypothetical protein
MGLRGKRSKIACAKKGASHDRFSVMAKYHDPKHRSRTEIEADERYARFRATSRHFEAVLNRNIRERPVTKVAMVGSAMTALKAKLEKRATALVERIEALDKAGDEKFALADHHLTAHETELAEMETELRQLGNFAPLPGSSTG